MPPGVNKKAFLKKNFKGFERDKKSRKIPLYLRQNTDSKNGLVSFLKKMVVIMFWISMPQIFFP